MNAISFPSGDHPMLVEQAQRVDLKPLGQIGLQRFCDGEDRRRGIARVFGLELDDCHCWNSGWQDFSATARYNLVDGAFADYRFGDGPTLKLAAGLRPDTLSMLPAAPIR